MCVLVYCYKKNFINLLENIKKICNMRNTRTYMYNILCQLVLAQTASLYWPRWPACIGPDANHFWFASSLKCHATDKIDYLIQIYQLHPTGPVLYLQADHQAGNQQVHFSLFIMNRLGEIQVHILCIYICVYTQYIQRKSMHRL